MAFTSIRVTRRYLQPNLQPARGKVTFTPTAPMVNDGTVVAAPQTFHLVSGTLGAVLAATDDAATLPTGVTYLVREQIDGQTDRRYYVEVPFDAAGGTVDLTSLAAVAVPPTVVFPAPSYTDEQVRDVMGATLVEGSLVDIAVSDGGNTVEISTTATTNSTDAQLRDRSTHTGSQAIATVTGLQTALDGKTALSVDGVFQSAYDIDTDPLSAADVGLGNVNNTSDLAKLGHAARKYATGATNCWDFSVVTVALAATEFGGSDTAVFDLSVSNGISVVLAGTYLVCVEIGLGSTGSAGARTGLIRVNGTTRREFGPPGATVRHSASAVLVLAVNDVVTLGAYCETGNDSAVTIAAAPADTGLTVARLGA